MRGRLALCILAAFIFLALPTVYSALFTVYQTDQALVLRLGQPIRAVAQAGLNLLAVGRLRALPPRGGAQCGWLW